MKNKIYKLVIFYSGMKYIIILCLLMVTVLLGCSSVSQSEPIISASDKNNVLGPVEGKKILVPGHTVTIKASGADTNGKYSLLEVDLFGDGPPLHTHRNEDEIYYILEGEMKFLLGDKTFTATAGSTVFLPKGITHGFSRVGEESSKALVIISPAGFEQFFIDAIDLDVTDTETYVAKANALAEKYNMDIVGPPLQP